MTYTYPETLRVRKIDFDSASVAKIAAAAVAETVAAERKEAPLPRAVSTAVEETWTDWVERHRLSARSDGAASPRLLHLRHRRDAVWEGRRRLSRLVGASRLPSPLRRH